MDNPKNNKQAQVSMKSMFWRIDDILPMIKFISLKYTKQQASQFQQYALKPLSYAEPKTIVFYLPQLF